MMTREHLLNARNEQIQWILDHGVNMEGYIDNYGSIPVAQAIAIWDADIAELRRIQTRLDETSPLEKVMVLLVRR